jgi:hypothetical protein
MVPVFRVPVHLRASVHNKPDQCTFTADIGRANRW